MTTIRATCPTCGEIDLTPDQILLTVVRGGDEPVGPDSHYTFLCPSCTERVDKPADERIARLLSSGGVSVNVLGEDTEVSDTYPLPAHPEEPTDGAPLTYDDLLDLHLLLECEDWFDGLLALSV